MKRTQATQVILDFVARQIKSDKIKTSKRLKQAHDTLTEYLNQVKQ